MQEIDAAFQSCFQEIENHQSEFCFEITEDQFINERDYEEIKVLFNLVRLSLDNPEIGSANDKILTSDLRSISNNELEKVLIATEKAIEPASITIKSLSADKSSKIAKILLASKDIHDNSYLFETKAKKNLPVKAVKRLQSIFIDSVCVIATALIFSYLFIIFYMPELENLLNFENNTAEYNYLPVISLLMCATVFATILYPIFTTIFFKGTFGTLSCNIILKSCNNKKVSASQVILRYCSIPLSILFLCPINILYGKDTIHDKLSGTKLSY